MSFERVQEKYRAGYEQMFRDYIQTCQHNKRGWTVKNVYARGLHVPHLALTILCSSVKTVAGLASGVLSIALLGRVKKLNKYADVRLEALRSFLPHAYNDILGIINPRAALSEREVVYTYYESHTTLFSSAYFNGVTYMNRPKIGPDGIGDRIRESHSQAVDNTRYRGLFAKLLLKGKTVGYVVGSVVGRTVDLALGILAMPFDIIALGSHKSVHNLVVRGLRAPAIVGDLVVYTRTVFS